jgi:phosphoglucosamine mutase
MSRRFFGTDGVRGVANRRLTPELAFGLGLGAGRWLVEEGAELRATIGMDTRRSGPMLASALASGLCSAGIDVVHLGVAPTPTVSHAARTGSFGLGAIVSASHNPAPDNGIKFVGSEGRKLPDEVEARIEALMDPDGFDRPTGGAVGVALEDPRPIEAYLEFLVSIVPERLEGLRVAVDGAHGAAYRLAPEVLCRLGAEVVVVGDSPNGMNINAEGGATKPLTVQELTVSSGSAVGVAFDGDADRAVFSDDRGQLINGDRTIGIWSAFEQRRGTLDPAIVVGTVMSNGGFEAYLASQGIRLERTPVGDKYVAQCLEETGARVGGEQSGHVIFPERGPTGDGLVTMLELLRVLRLEGCSSSDLSSAYEPWPQLLINVQLERMNGWDSGPQVGQALARARERLAGCGRLVVRASGTQPMVRVMVEANESQLRDEVASSIVDAMQEEAGATVYSRVDLTHALGD